MGAESRTGLWASGCRTESSRCAGPCERRKSRRGLGDEVGCGGLGVSEGRGVLDF